MTELNGDARRARLAATLLLTMPGIPFVYYGEEIGMTGAKPDPRLRTPMHWNRQASMGFTTGLPWEPLQPDSLSANVEAQDPIPLRCSITIARSSGCAAISPRSAAQWSWFRSRPAVTRCWPTCGEGMDRPRSWSPT